MENNNSNVNNNESGMLTSIWGNNAWNSLHCISFTYPEKPTEEDKQNYKTYFQTLKYVLPCCICRKHYTEHTKIGGDFEIKDEIFKNKESLTRWLYELHKNVDKSLGMNYDIEYDDVCMKYNSYVANCVMPMEKKIIAYKNAYDQEAPIVTYEIAEKFTDYAVKRGITNYKETLDKTFEYFKTKRDSTKNISENWIKRNADCWNLSKYMRTHGIIGFEDNKDGDYHKLPTVEELKMLQMMSTTLNEKTLEHMIKKIQEVEKTQKVDKMQEVDKIIKSLLVETSTEKP